MHPDCTQCTLDCTPDAPNAPFGNADFTMFWKCLKSYRLVMHPTAPSPSFLCTPDAPNLIADRQSESACIYGSRNIDLIVTKSVSVSQETLWNSLTTVRKLKEKGSWGLFREGEHLHAGLKRRTFHHHYEFFSPGEITIHFWKCNMGTAKAYGGRQGHNALRTILRIS